MKHLFVTFLFALALSLAGCASDPASVASVATANEKIAAKATIEFECPDSGCIFKKFAYTDPRDRAASILRMPTNGWDATIAAVREAKEMVMGVAPVVGVGMVAVKGFKAVADVAKAGIDAKKGDTNITDSHNTSTNSNTSNETTVGANSGANSGNVSTTENNASAGAVAGGGTANTSSTDSHSVDSHAVSNTATPTVVTVTQPAPLVVQPAVVNPVIVQ